MLCRPTDARWTERAARDMGTILVDHAHCEKKAASTAVGFLFRYPERTELASAMSRVAREELLHFERVLGELKRMGQPFVRLTPSPYGGELYRLVRSSQPHKLVDELLVSALIEARSCERFALLASAIESEFPSLAALYRELGPSEERHAQLYVDLACDVADAASVRLRLADLAAREAEIVSALGGELRLHAG